MSKKKGQQVKTGGSILKKGTVCAKFHMTVLVRVRNTDQKYNVCNPSKRLLRRHHLGSEDPQVQFYCKHKVNSLFILLKFLTKPP